MGFVNEYISPEDVKKYNLDYIDDRYLQSAHARDWTIDRGRDIYYRLVSMGREERQGYMQWHLWWQGKLISITEFSTDAYENELEAGITWNIENISVLDQEKIPWPNRNEAEWLAANKEQILEILKEVASVYQLGGATMKTASPKFHLTIREVGRAS